jgi:hypothetical protein
LEVKEMARPKKTKAEKVWAYLLKNPSAKPNDVAKACGCTAKYVYNLKAKIGTPKEILEQSTDKTDSRRTRVNLLSEASRLVDGDREEEHGDFRANAERIAAYWNTHLGLIDFITPNDVPTMMALLKIARAHQKPDRMDNYRDAAGYVALAGELAGGR